MQSSPPARVIIAQPPRVVFPALLAAIADAAVPDPAHDEPAVLRKRLAHSVSAEVGTAVDREVFACRDFDPFGPAKLATEVCDGATLIPKVTFIGDVQPLNGTKSSNSGALALRYSVEQLQADATRLGLSLDDVTESYMLRWRGHFPFPYKIFRIRLPGAGLAIATSESLIFKVHPKPLVLSITVYLR